MQNAFCHPDGSSARRGLPVEMTAAAVAPCAELIAAARRARVSVALVHFAHQPGYADGGPLADGPVRAIRHCGGLLDGT